jgi:hypothetical protein
MKKDARFWLTELDLSSKHESKWRKRARNVVSVYRDEQDKNDTRFNILWSNTSTQLPALYSNMPKPIVSRRHREEGEVLRLAAVMLERGVSYSLDPGGSYDFDRVAKRSVLDFLLPGRMQCRVKYHPIMNEGEREVEAYELPDGVEEYSTQEDGSFLYKEKFDELVDEEVRIYHVPWDQYRQSVANYWEDVWWVAFGNNFLSREEIIEQFGAEHADVPLTHIAHNEERDGEASKGETRQVKKAQVWEIWDRDERKVCAVVEGYDKLLMSEDDPLKLRGFFPCPEPGLIVETTDTLIPIPEYCQYQYQAEELNLITQRIENLVKAMKLAGVYPGSQKHILETLVNSKENTLVPIEDWGAITERGGLGGMIEWLPLRDVADAWQRLMVYRQTLVESIFELTGISDIQRGSTDPRETKGAQQIKASFAGRRLLPKQQEVQRFFRDLFRMQSEIIAEHFQTETIFRMSQTPPSEEAAKARELLRDDALRSFVIDIETDSTIAPDDAMEKQGVAEFVTAISQYMNQVFPIVQSQPAAMAPLGKMMVWIARKFRIARDAEDELNEFLDTFEQLPQQQDQEAEAKKQEGQMKMQEAQMAAQMKAQESQANLQIKREESQADIQRKNLETQATLQREQAKSDLENRKLLLDIAEKEAKIRLMQEEAEAKVTLQAVDMRAKRMSESNSSATQKAESLATPEIKIESEPKARKITLLKGTDGKVEGAEITPIEEKKSVRFERGEDDRITGAEVE